MLLTVSNCDCRDSQQVVAAKQYNLVLGYRWRCIAAGKVCQYMAICYGLRPSMNSTAYDWEINFTQSRSRSSDCHQYPSCENTMSE